MDEKLMGTVFITDDEPVVLKALQQSIASLGLETHVFQSAHECIAALAEKPCSLLITDVNMPGLDGLGLLEYVKKNSPLTEVLVMSGYGDIPMAVRAIQKGAVDFIEKPLNEDTILPAVMLALKRSELSQQYSITDAEARVLKYVAEGKSNKEIAFLLARSVRTVENHRQRLLKKLNVDNVAGLVRIAMELGLAPEKAHSNFGEG